MFRVTRDPSYGSSMQCLAKITVMVFFVSIDMDIVSVMTAYLPVVRVCTAQSLICKYAAITPTTSTSTDTIEPLL